MNKREVKDFYKDSKELLKELTSNSNKVETVFKEYEKKYKEIIFNSESSLKNCIPFYVAVEEYLYNNFAKEHGVTSIELICEEFYNEIQNKFANL